MYPVLLVYELIKLYLLLKLSLFSGNSMLTISWYAGTGLLCLIPILFLMLALDEDQFRQWLPLVSLIKALGIPGLIFFIIKNFIDAWGFASSGNFILLSSLLSAAFFILCDTAAGIFCFGRSRILCK